MAYLRGMGAANPDCKSPWFALNNFSMCFVDSAVADYQYWFGSPSKVNIAPPVSPTGSRLTVPPASGEDAQATVDAISNQQLRDQHAINAAAIANGGHWYWDVEGAAAEAGDAIGEAAGAASDAVKSVFDLPWGWILGGLGVFAVVAFSGSGPRRYGR